MSALAAVLAITMVLSLYAGVYDDTIPTRTDEPSVASTTDRLLHALTTGAVIDPTALTHATIDAAIPESIAVAVTVYTHHHRWSVGPTPPDHATRTVRTVPVRVEGEVHIGHLQVVVWT